MVKISKAQLNLYKVDEQQIPDYKYQLLLQVAVVFNKILI